jgi:hypothetical protein
MTKHLRKILFSLLSILLVSCSVIEAVDETIMTTSHVSTETAIETNTAVSLSELSDPTLTPFQPVSDVARVYLSPAFPVIGLSITWESKLSKTLNQPTWC